MSQDDESSFLDFKRTVESDASLPPDIEPTLLRRYLKVCESDGVKALELLKSNFKLRRNGPQIFLNRDVLSDEIQTIARILQFCPLPTLTADNKRIMFARFTTSDTSEYSVVDAIKMMLMALDARYVTPDDGEKLADGDILILDMNGYTFNHFLEAARNPKSIFLYFKYVQETVPIETKAAHILNPSWIVDKFMALIRPVLKKEVADSFRFYSNGIEDLYESVPREVLPNEYGGSAGSIEDLHKAWMEVFLSKRSYLMNDSHWKLAE